MNAPNLNLFVVDDDEAVRRSLSALLIARGYPVQAFASGEAFLSTADLQRGGCVVLDRNMAGMSGLDVFERMREVKSPLVVLFLSSHGNIPIATGAVKDGAAGWLEKPCTPERLLEEVTQALGRSAAIDARQRARAGALGLWGKLTPREKEVARLVADGKSSKEVARELSPVTDPRTVDTHRGQVVAKLGINSTRWNGFLRDHDL